MDYYFSNTTMSKSIESLKSKVLPLCPMPSKSLPWPGLRIDYAGGSFGSHGDIHGNLSRWEFMGNIRKINVKSRYWDNRSVIQGFQVFLDDGSTKAFGMTLNDVQGVTSLQVPENQHIKTVANLRAGWYIDAIGFETNERISLGPVGGNGGNHYITVDYKYRGSHHYLAGMRGMTVQSQDAPCICNLQFIFVIIDDIESIYRPT